jgi:hypothetical protein
VGIWRIVGSSAGSTSSSLNPRRMLAAIAFTSSCPNRIPMHVRDPPPNGTYAPFGSAAFASGAKRSGRNSDGSGNTSGRWWLAHEQ